MSAAWLPITEDQLNAWTRGSDYGPWVRVRANGAEIVARWVEGDSIDCGPEVGDVWAPAHWEDLEFDDLAIEPAEWAPLETATGPDEGRRD